MSRFQAQLGGRKLDVEVIALDGGKFRVRVDGRELEVDSISLLSGGQSMLIDGAVCDTQMEINGDDYEVLLRGVRVRLKMIAERKLKLQALSRSQGGGGDNAVKAPMPGRVVRIPVEKGQQVEQGQGVAVIEAMKMQNELRAPRAGVVDQILVKVGQDVERGAPLVILA
ncbi:MAG: hypothetical protein GMKNLPBB_03390 [Myxococcota bacterium]|nr:hypothetical protein [Myxococcota bacterium]